jgi:uncharacterized protein
VPIPAHRCLWAALIALSIVGTAQAQNYTLPKVRAITGFIRLDRARYAQQIADTLTVLRAAKAEFVRQGYDVETLRVVTQPVGQLIGGQSDADALAFLKSLDDLSAKEGFIPNVGPAMLSDGDDTHAVRVLEQALSKLPNLEANTIIAGDDGIHWKVIHETAKLVHYVTEHSVHSQGDFNFTATAMLKPYAPFYPGAYFTDEDKRFSIGFQGASIVQEVFARTHGNFDASVAELTKQLTVHAKVAESIGYKVAASSGWTFMGVDPTPAPLGDVSIGAAIETYTGARFGSSGTMTAALVITTAVKAVDSWCRSWKTSAWRSAGPRMPITPMRCWPIPPSAAPASTPCPTRATSPRNRWFVSTAMWPRSPGSGRSRYRRDSSPCRGKRSATAPSSRMSISSTPLCMPCPDRWNPAMQ